MQPVLLEVLQQRAAGRMHDAFGYAGGARREQDESGWAKGSRVEAHRLGGEGRQ